MWPGKEDTQVVDIPIVDSINPRPKFLPPAVPADLADRIAKAGFIFEHLARNPRFDNVTRRPGHSRGPHGFLPVSIEGMSFFIGLFLKEKGTFAFLGALSLSKSPKDLFSRKRTVKMTSPLTLEKSARSREYPGRLVALSRRGAKF